LVGSEKSLIDGMNILNPVLYAEDDENDMFFMERAFEKLKIEHPLRIVQDGKQAIAYLSSSGSYFDRSQNPIPSLILLDLSMPGKGGLDVLQWVRTQPSLSEIPVVVLTSSNQESDVHRAGILGANGYIIKPGEPDELIEMVRQLHKYWLLEGHPPTKFVEVGRVCAASPEQSPRVLLQPP
jgi:CheY-like chemotaxis protein